MAAVTAPAHRPDGRHRRDDPGRAGPDHPADAVAGCWSCRAGRARARRRSRCTARPTCSTPTATGWPAAACWSSVRTPRSCATSGRCCPRWGRPASCSARSGSCSRAWTPAGPRRPRSPRSRAAPRWRGHRGRGPGPPAGAAPPGRAASSSSSGCGWTATWPTPPAPGRGGPAAAQRGQADVPPGGGAACWPSRWPRRLAGPGSRGLLDAGDLADIRDELAESRELTRELDALWPTLSPEQLLTDLFADPRRLDSVGPAAARRGPGALLRPAPPRTCPPTCAGRPPTSRCSTRPPSCSATTAPRPRGPRGGGAARGGAATPRACWTCSTSRRTSTPSCCAPPTSSTPTGSPSASGCAATTPRPSGPRRTASGPTATSIVDEAQELSAMAWRLIMRRCPTRSMTIVGDIAQTGDLAGAASWQDALGPVRGEAVQARAAHRELPDPRGDRRGGRRRARRDRPDAGRRRGRCGRRACRRGRCSAPGSLAGAGRRGRRRARRRSAAGLGDRDARRTRREVPARPGRRAGPDGPGGRAARAGAARRRRRRRLRASRTSTRRWWCCRSSAAKGLEFDAVVLVEPAELVAESPRGLNDLYVALTRATQRLTVVHRGAAAPGAAPAGGSCVHAHPVAGPNTGPRVTAPGGAARPGVSGGDVTCRRAAATRAATSRTSAASSSGCHWTPTTNGRAGSSPASSTASTVPSAAQPVATRPGASRSTAWWWWHRTRTCGPTTAPTRPAGSSRTSTSVKHARCRVVPVVADDVGQVLVQRAAERDVEQLRAPADPQHRQVQLQRPVQDGQLGRVALRVRGAGGGVRGGAVAVGGDVAAAAEQHGVHAVDRPRRLRRRGQQHGHAARGEDDVDVGAGSSTASRPRRRAGNVRGPR